MQPAAKKAKKVNLKVNFAGGEMSEKEEKERYANRKNCGRRACEGLNVHLEKRALWEDLGTRSGSSRFEFERVAEVEAYRYMFAPPSARCSALGARLEEEEGMIACEGLTGKLNKESLIMDTGEARVRLDMSGVGAWSCFPGQVVRARGSMEEGVLRVEEMVAPTARAPRSNASEARRYASMQNHKPLAVWCAAGPYTTNDNLDFLPLNDLLEAVSTQAPDVLVLCGPFVDEKHPLPLKIGDDFVDPFTLFAVKVAWRLADSPPTKIVLVPSPTDAIAHSVFPQPPLSDRKDPKFATWDQDLRVGTLDLPAHVACVSNPAVFRINEIVVGVATDVLFDLASEEKSKGMGDAPRVPRLAGHLLAQRSFYPLVPAVSMPLDLGRLDSLRMPPLDVLLVPSKLAVFATPVDHVVVVNPGPLAKGAYGGAFAQLTIHPLTTLSSSPSEEEEEAVLHKVPERTRVDIVRI
ncbi:hypothetical protein CTAYLR_004487 [Chrysophaeum taylorii]|uniref:DNA polymerase alpha subunit B n=1 Tax=Chrysophaeum taylorii TaxID=2483200 RepID=A0AAD7UBS2_9STRA|nr:hypothetical protein CTAYLR_004487 [Chrysophaeum taylorii]